MRDLHEVLAGSLSARERVVAGQVSTDEVLAGTVSRVRRRRRVRAAARGGAVLGVGALVVAVGWGVWGRQVPVPAVSPTVSVSPTPTRTPTSTPTQTETAPAVFSVLGLGDLPQATEATLAKATTGWALVDYGQEEEGDSPETRGPSLVHALLLVDPTGAVYHLTDLPPSSEVPIVLLGRWVPGQRTATVALGQLWADGVNSFAPATLDLLTATVTQGPVVDGYPLAALADGSWLTATVVDYAGIAYARVSSDGVSTPLAEVSDIDGISRLSPDGTQVVVSDRRHYAVLDTATGDVVERSWDATSCSLINWVDDDTFAASCSSSEASYGDGRTAVTHPTRIAVRASDGAVMSSVDLRAGDFWGVSGTPTTTGLVVSGGALEAAVGLEDGVLTPALESENSALLMSPDASTEALRLSLPDGVRLHAQWSGGRYAYLVGWSTGSSVPRRDLLVAVDTSTGAVTTPFTAEITGALDSLELMIGQ